MTILLGNGDGTFAAGYSTSVGNSPTSIAVGDFNKDGASDLAVTNSFDSTVTILTAQLVQTATATASGISPAGQGSHAVLASYPGDSDYQASTSGTTDLTATLGGLITPFVTVALSSPNITPDQSLTVTVTVSGGNGNPTPTGSITLSSGSYSQQQTLSSGTASITIAAGTLSGGADTLSAAYSGDGIYAAEVGTSTVTVSKVIVTASAPPPLLAGNTATGTVTFTANNAYAGTMSVKCALTSSPTGAQSLPSCSLNPASVPLTAGGSGTTAYSVKTAAASSASVVHPNPFNLWRLGAGGSVLAFGMMFGIRSRRRRWISMLSLLLILIAGSIGCGGGGGSSPSPSPAGTPATTVGSYTFTVTAVDSVDTKITASATFIVVVQ
ncbi:MAG TPA: VCBS repeat-containing protein [Terracidiphilus sp.]